MPEPSNPPAASGWYNDGSGGQRYWDGQAWTDHRAPAAVLPAAIQPVYVQLVRPITNPLAIWALVLGILGVLPAITIVLVFVSTVPSILAVIFGFVGLNKSKTLNGLGRGASIAGIILGFIPVGISILVLVVAGIGSGTNTNS